MSVKVGGKDLKSPSVHAELFWLLLSMACLVLVCMPRFNQRDWGFLASLTGTNDPSAAVGNDAAKYVMYVRYFQGRARLQDLRAPFVYRPLVPFISARLPFDPMTAINLVNLFSLLWVIVLLYRFLRFIGFEIRSSIVGCFMFAVSFPAFYYGTIGLVDPVLILAVTAGLYALFAENWAGLTLAVLFGSLVKETAAILIPVLAIRLILKRKPWKFGSAMLLVAYLGTMLALRLVLSDVPGTSYLQISIGSFMSNLRLRALLSTLLTFGIPGLLATAFLIWYAIDFKDRKKAIPLFHVLPLAAGILFTLALGLYSMFSAHTDGRFIWLLYPFAIPLALWFLEGLAEVHAEFRQLRLQRALDSRDGWSSLSLE